MSSMQFYGFAKTDHQSSYFKIWKASCVFMSIVRKVCVYI